MPDSLEKARAQGLRLVKFRPRSEAELRRRLLEKGHGDPTIEQVISEFKKQDLINDAKFARYFANQRMMLKPMGRQGLKRELKAKGVDLSLAALAVEEAAGETSEIDRARELARGRMGTLRGLGKEASQRRLLGFLSRRGFSSDVIYRVVREVEGAG